MKIFWVTKNPIFPGSFERFLNEEGILLETICIDPNQAIEKYSLSQADIVLMDFSWYSNEISGIALLHSFKKLDPSIKVIFVTSYFQEVVENKFEVLGAAGYINQNDMPENIIACIKAVDSSTKNYVEKKRSSLFA